jgi:hypothetical protein
VLSRSDAYRPERTDYPPKQRILTSRVCPESAFDDAHANDRGYEQCTFIGGDDIPIVAERGGTNGRLQSTRKTRPRSRRNVIDGFAHRRRCGRAFPASLSYLSRETLKTPPSGQFLAHNQIVGTRESQYGLHHENFHICCTLAGDLRLAETR